MKPDNVNSRRDAAPAICARSTSPRRMGRLISPYYAVLPKVATKRLVFRLVEPFQEFLSRKPGVGSSERHLTKRPHRADLLPLHGRQRGLQVRQFASSTSSERDDVVDGQVIGRSALRAVGLAQKLHLPELLPCTAVATLRGRASALPLLPLVLAQALAAAATAAGVRLVVAIASVADAELHITLAGAQSCCATSPIVSRRGEVRPSASLGDCIDQIGGFAIWVARCRTCKKCSATTSPGFALRVVLPDLDHAQDARLVDRL
jgi:hypothetical protein